MARHRGGLHGYMDDDIIISIAYHVTVFTDKISFCHFSDIFLPTVNQVDSRVHAF